MTVQNVLFDKAKIDKLLVTIRTDKFIGTVDPEYHACYFEDSLNSKFCSKQDEIMKDFPLKTTRSFSGYKKLSSSASSQRK
jgi:hypothetical protein